MKKLKLLYLIICILLILFFCTACIFTQCSRAITSLVFNTAITKNSDFTDGSDTTQAAIDAPASASEETYGRDNNAEGLSSSTELGDYSSSGISVVPVNFKITYEFLITGDTDSVTFTACIPADYKYRQKINDYGFSVRPDMIFTDAGNSYAKFKLINPVNKYFISMDIQMELFDFDLLAAKKTPGNLFSVDMDKDIKLPEGYLVSEEHLESDDFQIEAAADSIYSTSQLDLVSRMYSFVLDRMQYSGYNPSDVGAAEALAGGSGDCTEYSDLFVALCRAKGIPARVIEGYAADAGPDDLRFGHNWAEVYFDDFGWVPFDPIYDDNNGSSPETTFENLKNIYVYTGFKRNDDILMGYHYYVYNYYGDSIEVKKTVNIN